MNSKELSERQLKIIKSAEKLGVGFNHTPPKRFLNFNKTLCMYWLDESKQLEFYKKLLTEVEYAFITAFCYPKNNSTSLNDKIFYFVKFGTISNLSEKELMDFFEKYNVELFLKHRLDYVSGILKSDKYKNFYFHLEAGRYTKEIARSILEKSEKFMQTTLRVRIHKFSQGEI
jgi:hypothetical protein